MSGHSYQGTRRRIDHKARTEANADVVRYRNLYEAAEECASVVSDYAPEATGAAANQLSAATSAVGDYALSAGDAASSQYSVVSSLISELVIDKEPTFTESVYSRLAGLYSLGASSASSLVSMASERAASAASDVTDVAETLVSAVGGKGKEDSDRVRDEL